MVDKPVGEQSRDAENFFKQIPWLFDVQCNQRAESEVGPYGFDLVFHPGLNDQILS